MIKWAYTIRQSYKVAIGLTLIQGSVLLANIWETKAVSNMDKSFSSLYDDRLMPATYLFNISDHLYKKRNALEYCLADIESAVLKQQKETIAIHNLAVDSLIENFEKTYLVREEKKVLAALKQNIAEYRLLEASLLSQPLEDIRFSGKKQMLQDKFFSMLSELNALSHIQVEVALDLKKDSRYAVSSSNLLFQFEIVLLIVIGIVINVMILSSRSISFSMTKGSLQQWQN